MTPQTIGYHLRRSGFWHNVCVVDSLPSSIDELKAQADHGATEGSVVLALTQTRARGRAGRSWQAPRGGVWLSALLRPNFAAEHAGCVSVLVAVALAEAFAAAFGLPVKVKWPNDLWLERKKLSGILIDLSTRGPQIDYMIVSVGTNVNNVLPKHTPVEATSLSEALGRPLPLERVAAVVLDALADGYEAFLRGGFQPFIERFEALSALGKVISFERDGNVVTAHVVGLNGEGKLVVQTAHGQQLLAAEEVHLEANEGSIA